MARRKGKTNRRARQRSIAAPRRPFANQFGAGPTVVGGKNSLLSVLDPFCEGAARWPDGSSVKSLPIHLRRLYTVTTGVDGRQGILFYPGRLNNHYYDAPTMDAFGTVTSWGAAKAHPDYTQINTDFEDFRVVSIGYKFTFIHKSTEGQGILAVKSGMTNASTTSTTTKFDDSVERQWYGSPTESFGVILHPAKVSARNFARTDTSDYTNWPYLAVYLEGCQASSAIIAIEEHYHIELTSGFNNFYSRLVQEPAPRNSGLLDAIGDFMQGTATVVHNADEFAKNAMQFIGTVGAAAGTAMAMRGARFAGRNTQPTITYRA